MMFRSRFAVAGAAALAVIGSAWAEAAAARTRADNGPICQRVTAFVPDAEAFAVLKPERGATNLTVRLPRPVKVDDSTAWFTVNATKSGNGRFRVWCVLENEQGGEVASVSTWHNGGAYDWFELGSDWTFLRRAPYDPYYPEERRGLKVRELRFEIKGDVGEIYCEPPVLMGGNLFDRSLVATTLTEERTKTTYGAYGDIFTGVYGGDYEATLELRDAFQAKPFLTRTKTFRLKDTTGAARARLTRQGFALPPLKKGYYEYTITRRTLDSGALDGPPRKGFYGVLSSPAADVPREDARLANPLFVPTASNFVFDAPQVTGTIQTPDFSADKLSRPPYRLAYALEEYSARWHRSNASRPVCYWRNGAAVSAAGAQVAIDIPVDRDLVRCNRAFTLRMEIFDGRGLRVAESTATVGVKGRDNVYRPKKGAKLTWQEVCARPAIRATGIASVTLPQNDLRAFTDKIRYLGGYNTFLCDGAWSLETEPIKGFRTYDYLERQIAAATDAGLDVAIQIGGIHNDPAWAKFEYEPARVNDGRFLAPHYNNISVWADAPANCIKAFMRDTVARYAGVPNLAYWKCWCYEGEGFTHDWFYMWMFGDTVSGYCEPKRRQYRAWLERKYGTVERLNAAHGSQWASFADVEPPQPDDPLRHRDRLRNPPPVTTAAYVDFYRSKREDFQDYWENFVLKTLRPLDPERLFAAYYYPDAEGDDIATKGVFTRNPGFIKHNGGMQGDRFFGYQPFEYARYEGMPGFITEDVAVWNDRVREWDDEVFGALRLAGGGANFFNYSIYQTRAHDVEHEPNDRGKTAFFEAMGREFFPTVRKMRRPPTRLAVYQNNLRNDNYHGHAWPFGDLWYSRYAPEPICGKYLDRLASHYDVLALDSGAESAPEADLDAIAAWVRNGGTLVMTPATLAWTSEELMQHPGADARNHEAPDRHPNALLDRLGLSLPTAGTWATSVTGRFSAATCDRAAFPTCTNLFFKNAFSPIRKMVNIDGLGYGREFRPDGYSIYDFSAQAYPQAKVLARMDSPRALSGRPAALELRAVKGRVILLAQYPQIVDVAFWSDLCSYLGVTRDLSFAGAASDADTFLPWTIGYLLEAADGSYMAMTEEMEDRTSYRRTSFPRDETLPYRRRVRLHTLKPGNYRVSEFRLGVRTERGVFSAAQLDRQGLDYAYDHDQQFVAFYLEPVK